MKIACVLDRGFEDSEFEKPYNAFQAAGHEVTIVGHEAGKEITGSKGRVTTKTEKGIDEVSPDQFDALFIPGGSSPDHLRVNPKVNRFVAALMEAGKPAFAICHGPQLLIAADQYQDRTMTAWYTIQDDLKKMGAKVVDEEVHVDGNLVTSRKPDDIPAFIRESLALLKEPARARA
jgi:protease I